LTPPPERVAPGPAAGFSQALIAWQRREGRHGLPWQGSRDAYRVWLSEVMLQQTQVSTVLGYYGRFLERFPTVQALAAAPQDEVLALWSGLGYYSRARYLHRAAQVVVAEHGGRFPGSAAELERLPGIGRSTAAAIAAFCFGERVAILDGNVKRVLSRVLAFGGDLAEAREVEALWGEATRLLPEHGIEPYTQGLMDLGATLCRVRSPDCLLCPVQALCLARRSGAPENFPVKSRRTRRSRRHHAILWLCQGSQHWLVKRPGTGVWAGLWSLPEFASADALAGLAAEWRGSGEWLQPIQHALTHFDWQLDPLRWTLPARAAVPKGLPHRDEGRWFSREEALALGLAAPIRKLLAAAE
jgi:A/G-specific adenine glycosylase